MILSQIFWGLLLRCLPWLIRIDSINGVKIIHRNTLFLINTDQDYHFRALVDNLWSDISHSNRTSDVNLTCKGICGRHKAFRPPSGLGRYFSGQKRCQVCEIFIKWEALNCPCCGCRLRIRPRNGVNRRKMARMIATMSNTIDQDQQALVLYH